jgi:hypothetical protein
MAVVAAALQPGMVLADTPAALTAIADTADRICGIIVTQGESSGVAVQGDIHAQLNGLAKRLATFGGMGKVDITSSGYQGLLQQDLAGSLKDLRQCKLQVLATLQNTLLPGTVRPSGPGAPSADLLQAPANAPTVDSVTSQQNEYGLYGCSNEATNITCYIIMSRTGAGAQDYRIDAMRTDAYKLVDNFHIEHRLRRAFFIDGLRSRQQATNLSTGESIWLALEFEPVARPISSARIVFVSMPYSPQLRGPVN